MAFALHSISILSIVPSTGVVFGTMYPCSTAIQKGGNLQGLQADKDEQPKVKIMLQLQ